MDFILADKMETLQTEVQELRQHYADLHKLLKDTKDFAQELYEKINKEKDYNKKDEKIDMPKHEVEIKISMIGGRDRIVCSKSFIIDVEYDSNETSIDLMDRIAEKIEQEISA